MIRKSMPSGDEPMGGSGIPSRQTRNTFARRSRSNKKIERDDDSKKSHHALLARAFGSRFRLLHPFCHLRFDCVKVEARASLHRRVIEESLEFLAHYLLNEHETPELVFEPIEVLLPAFFRPIVWPARALERIQPQVGDVRYVRLGFFAQPAGGLVDEAELIVVNAHRADRAFAQVENLVARGRAFAGDGSQLIVAI